MVWDDTLSFKCEKYKDASKKEKTKTKTKTKTKIKDKNKKGKCQRPSSCQVEAEIKSKLFGKYMGTTSERKSLLKKAN